MQKVEHIGIAVKNLEASKKLFESLLNTFCYKVESVESEMVSTAFFKVGDTKIELLETTNPEGAVGKFIEKRGEGLHHIAYEVADIHAEIKRLKAAGFVFTRQEPFRGADNKMVIFLHPKSTNGVLIELCQEIVGG
ncbi:MAG TPA: methylmalonyl-CoA epimerase [Bacteroidetes bacterium]|nr:methylmalonyl-CoA epimerase [Bacteroidota bacterium]